MYQEKEEIAIAHKNSVVWNYILYVFSLASIFSLLIQLLEPYIIQSLPNTSNYILDTILVCSSYLPFSLIAAYFACSLSTKRIIKKKNILKSYIPHVIRSVSIYFFIVGILYCIVSASNALDTYQSAVYSNPEFIEREKIVYESNNQSLIDTYEIQKNKSMKNAQNILLICVVSTKIIETIFYLIFIKSNEKTFFKFAYDDDLIESDPSITKYSYK